MISSHRLLSRYRACYPESSMAKNVSHELSDERIQCGIRQITRDSYGFATGHGGVCLITAASHEAFHSRALQRTSPRSETICIHLFTMSLLRNTICLDEKKGNPFVRVDRRNLALHLRKSNPRTQSSLVWLRSDSPSPFQRIGLIIDVFVVLRGPSSLLRRLTPRAICKPREDLKTGRVLYVPAGRQ